MSSLTSSSSPSSPLLSRTPIPPPPATQCLSSETFHPPALDGSMALPEIYDWHLHNSPDHPLFVYDDDEGAERGISWGTAVRAVHRAARIIQSRVDVESADSATTRRPPVVGILASSGKSFHASRYDLRQGKLMILVSTHHRHHNLLHIHRRHHACRVRRLPHLHAELPRRRRAPPQESRRCTRAGGPRERAAGAH